MIGIGLIGCGSFAQRRILTTAVEGLRFVCLQKRDLKEAKEVAARFGVPHAVSSRAELLAHPDVDAVIITSANDCHEDDALAAARARKPTLCEKPLAPTTAAIKRMLAAFEGLPFLVGHSLRFKLALQKARALLAEKTLGDLLHIRAYFGLPVPSDNWRYRSGAGVLDDIGVHLIDLIRYVTGQEIIHAHALGTKAAVVSICTLTSGATASFECSFLEPLRSGFELIGTEGHLVSSDSLRQTTEPVETLFLNKEEITLPFVNVYEEELKHFRDVINGAKPLIPAVEGLHNQEVIERIRIGS